MLISNNNAKQTVETPLDRWGKIGYYPLSQKHPCDMSVSTDWMNGRSLRPAPACGIRSALRPIDATAPGANGLLPDSIGGSGPAQLVVAAWANSPNWLAILAASHTGKCPRFKIMQNTLQSLVECVQQDLLPHLHLESVDPHNPVVVHRILSPWQCLGAGNYAAVFVHPAYPDQVVKVYAPGRPGWDEEVEVYRRLGEHAAFSQCYASGDTFLILKRLHGVTLYDCLHKGIAIPPQVILDIDAALAYARSRGLSPHDVHGRNVMLHEGRGLVVDISDFLRAEPCRAWEDVKRAYRWFYRPLLLPLRLRVPYWLLDWVRAVYRCYRRSLRLLKR